MYKDFLCVVEAFRGGNTLCGRREAGGIRRAIALLVPEKPAAPSVAGESGTVFGLDFGDHAAADAGRGGQTVLCPFYGSTPGHHLARAGGRRAALKLWEGLGYYSRARNLKKGSGLPDGRLRRSDACVAG